MTEKEIKRLAEEHKKALAHLMTALDQMPSIKAGPCWMQRVFTLEPSILLEKHKLNGGHNGIDPT